MILTDSLKSLVKQIAIVVLVHSIMLVVYSYAHQKIDLLYLISAYLPLLLIMCFAPLVAATLLFTQSVRQGAVIMLGVLPAELIYTVIARFGNMPPFQIQEPELIWKILYEASFGVLLVLEVTSFWLTAKVLGEIHAQLKQQSESKQV